jgi:hypothetical protein
VITRRRFVQLVGGGAAALAVGCGDNIKLPLGIFFDEHQWAAIDLATDLVLPGASAALAVRYIDTLLAAFERFPDPPHIFAGGPFSGRRAYPDTTGAESHVYPDASFDKFLPLSRVHEIAWRLRIYGSDQMPGWRDLYVDLVEQLDAAAKQIDRNHPLFVLLAPADQGLALDTVASNVPASWQMLVEHTLEGTFCAPEYGGNANLAGWQLARYDGDSAPLGYAYYDEAAGMYRERADQPTSQPTPGDGPEEFDPDIVNLLTVAAVGSGGKRFF